MENRVPTKTFLNPVYSGSFPDPFVLSFSGEYFAYCTGTTSDGRVFGRLRSFDLVEWEELPGAMMLLQTGEPYYWAPEVTYRNGKFYLYYSVGNETFMRIRVAVSDTPGGTFMDVGKDLTDQDFAIDPHVFRDDDGRWFMFYATDFLHYSHIGTGTVVDEMLDPFTLGGDPKPVTRAQFDWQVYDPARKEKGGVRWHTVEGPFVLKRKGIYYEMFSGGNWKNISYGVSFAVSETLTDDHEWSQFCDGKQTRPILRTIPGKVIGPGHNSVVSGPNGRELYCVYHRWQGDNRVMAIDRMDFCGAGRLFIIGPSTHRQPVPYEPLKRSDLTVPTGKLAEIFCDLPSSFFCRLSFRFLESQVEGFHIVFDNEVSFDVNCPGDRDLLSIHELGIEIDHRFIRLTLNRGEVHVTSALVTEITRMSLFSQSSSVKCSAISVTTGFEDLFEADDLELRGWTVSDAKQVRRKDNCLYILGDGEAAASISRKVSPGDNEVCLNLRFEQYRNEISSVDIVLSRTFTIVPSERSVIVGNIEFELPAHFSPDLYHQFRFVSIGEQTTIHIDADVVGTVENSGAADLRIVTNNCEVSFDMIRHTMI